MANYQFYRNTTLGATLQETLEDMIEVEQRWCLSRMPTFALLSFQQRMLTEQAANKILSEFDRSINLALEKRINKKVSFVVRGKKHAAVTECSSFARFSRRAN